MISRYRLRIAIGLLVLAIPATWLLATLAGTGTAADRFPPSALNMEGPETVTVARQDITEVLAIAGTVTATPVFTVAAAETGQVTRGGRVRPGTVLSAGTILFTMSTGAAVTMPVPGSFERWLVPDGAVVTAGVPVAQVSYAGFGHVAVLPPQDAYRILAGELAGRANIAGGPGPFNCPVLQAPAGADGNVADGLATTDGPTVICAIPLEIRVFPGLTGMVAVTSRQVHDVLVLPVNAVAGTVQTGEVTLIDTDGGRTVVQVGLGITDGSVVEITSGLAEGSVVLAKAPPLVGLP